MGRDQLRVSGGSVPSRRLQSAFGFVSARSGCRALVTRLTAPGSSQWRESSRAGGNNQEPQ